MQPVPSAIASLALVAALSTTPAAAETFDPGQALCDRPVFTLEDPAEVAPWLDYVTGLRTGRTAPPDQSCPSTSFGALIAVLTSETEEQRTSNRASFLAHFPTVEQSAEELAAIEPAPRYLQDLAMANLISLTCPDDDEGKSQCVAESLATLPAPFLASSPVFCNFAPTSNEDALDLDTYSAQLPLLCAPGQPADAWLSAYVTLLRS